MNNKDNKQDQLHDRKMVVADLKTLSQCAAIISKLLDRHCIVLLKGALGSGKTTFVQYLCQQLSVHEVVNSPTFIILKQYHGSWHKQSVVINHFDFYRLHQVMSASDGEMIAHHLQAGINLIEWPLAALEYDQYCDIVLTVEFTISANGVRVLKWSQRDARRS